MAEGDAEEAKNPQDKSEAEPSTPEAKPKKKAPKAKAVSENANPEKKEGAAESQKKTEAPAAKPEQAGEGGQKEGATEGEAEKKPKKTKPEGEQKKETQEAGAPHKKGLFAKLSEKLKKHAPADAEKKPAEKKEEEKKAKQQEDAAEKKEHDKKESLFKRLFKKKPQEEEKEISLAPTIVSSNTQVQAEVQIQRQEKLVTPTVAPVPQETFLKKLKHLFGKEPLLPLEIPTHCAVCGIDLHTVYSYTCANCRKVACYYCVRSFSEKTYCTKCLKDKGIL